MAGFVAVVVGIGLLAFFLVRYVTNSVRRLNVRIDRCWEALADAYEGEYARQDLGWFQGVSRDLYLNVDGIRVHADIFTRRVGDNTYRYTRLRANATAASDMTLKVYTENVFSGLARALGFQDIPVGDEEFDDTYIVKSNDPVFAKCWLNRTVRDLIYDSNYSFQLKSGRVTAERMGIETDVESFETGVLALAAFADAKHRVLKVFKKVAKKLGGTATKNRERWATLKADVDGMPVTIDTMDNGKSHYNVTTAGAVGAKLEPLVLTRDKHEFSRHAPPRRDRRNPRRLRCLGLRPRQGAHADHRRSTRRHRKARAGKSPRHRRRGARDPRRNLPPQPRHARRRQPRHPPRPRNHRRPLPLTLK